VSTSVRRVPALDGIRAVAVVLVFLRHSALRGVLPPGFGDVGVGIFFALSGFLITSLLLEERNLTRRVKLSSFYLRRAYRLLPALLVMLAVVALLAVLLRRHELFPSLIGAALYFANWAYISGFAQPGTGVEHAWSLSIEEHFYLVWPLLLLLLTRWLSLRKAAAVTLGICTADLALRLVLLARGADGLRVHYGSDTRADALLIGCAIALIAHPRRWRPPVLVTTAGCLAIAALSLLRTESVPMLTLGMTVLAVASSVVVLDVWHGGSVFGKVLAVRPLVALGRISYGFYLWHLPILYLPISAALLARLPAGRVTGTVLLFIVTLAVSALSYQFVERPFLRWKARTSVVSVVSQETTGPIPRPREPERNGAPLDERPGRAGSPTPSPGQPSGVPDGVE
jgi:peptidoglycan/LPS O-acetylase OafA/YrhL